MLLFMIGIFGERAKNMPVHHKPTDKLRKLVKSMILHDCSHEAVAKRLDICVETLHKYY
jgi:hypothetical protein